MKISHNIFNKSKVFKIVILCVLFLFALLLSACKDSVIEDGDIILSINVDKTEVFIGETIEIEIALENHSGRKIDMWDWLWGDLPDNPLDRIVQTTIIPDGQDSDGRRVGGLGTRTMPGISRWDSRWQRERLKAETFYSRTERITIGEELWWWNYFNLCDSTVDVLIVEGYMGFYTARGQHSQFFTLHTRQEITLKKN